MTEEHEAAAVAAGPGEQLRAAREKLGYSFDDVVLRLHLEAQVVSAIERDDLDGLGAPVFVKGYLRSYARLVGLPEQAVVDAWSPAEPAQQDLRTLSVKRELKAGANLANFVLWTLLGLLVLGAAIYLLSGNDAGDGADRVVVPEAMAPEAGAGSEPAVRPSTPTPEPEAAEFVPTEAEVFTPEPSVLHRQAPARTAPPASERPAEPAGAGAEAGSGSTELLLRFNDECWVEVSAGGQRLLYGLEKAGTERRFASVQPPMKFFVGNVDALTIRIGGRDYAIPQSVRTGRNTARFTLDADDIEQLQ